MKGLGLFTLVGHPLYWWIWSTWLPQPYENLPLRLFIAALGLVLMTGRISNAPGSRLSGQVFSAVMWLQLPFLFSWMYLCNGGSPAWLASLAAMVVIYYFVTDWRIATLGLLAAAIASRLLFAVAAPTTQQIPAHDAMTAGAVMAFCVSMGIMLGLSSANLRRERLAHTLATMGIMAHELRTPLATVSLLGDAVRNAATAVGAAGADMHQLSERLHQLARNMNHQIDIQIANARLMRLPVFKEAVPATQLVQHVVADYPFRTPREKACVQVRVQADFVFAGSEALFSQVLDNLMKNALQSLAAAGGGQPGDLLIEVDATTACGQIIVGDRGVGMGAALQARVFEPFFSTGQGTGHGLGLAFCQRVVHQAGGTLRVRSEPGQGAAFTIELPRLR